MKLCDEHSLRAGNVPRGTPETKAETWRVHCLHLPRPWRLALMKGLKTELRIPLDRANCIVHPGSFRGLDLDSGRARRGEVPQLRARCVFLSGNVRAVTVMPVLGRGDLLWIRAPRGARRRSRMTLEVTSVDISRVQDMQDADAVREGVGALPLRMRNVLKPRDWFAHFWEVWKGPRAWRRNPWVWVVRFNVHEEQVDALLKRWKSIGTD